MGKTSMECLGFVSSCFYCSVAYVRGAEVAMFSIREDSWVIESEDASIIGGHGFSHGSFPVERR